MSLKDLAEGANVEGVEGLVEKVEGGTTKGGKPFIRLTLRDESGSLPGVMWDASAEPWLKEGAVVKVSAKVGSYQGALQLNYDSISPSDKAPGLFAKRTKFDVEEMWGYLVEKVNSFKEPLTKYVAEEILLKHAEVIEALKKAPAAKGVHNAWLGGLLEHVWSLVQMGEFIVAHYQKHYCPQISRDKVLFGLMIHDAGKIVEYDFSTPALAYTGLGTLANHMVLGPAWVFEAANRWPGRTSMATEAFKLERAQLMHVLAAHHGQIEWGSPVRPATIEAILVHHLDNTDGKVLHALDYVLGKPGTMAGFSEKSYIEKVCYMQYPKD